METSNSGYPDRPVGIGFIPLLPIWRGEGIQRFPLEPFKFKKDFTISLLAN
jgi:hypothetical protein